MKELDRTFTFDEAFTTLFKTSEKVQLVIAFKYTKKKRFSKTFNDDGVAMGSPLGPLMANVFLCHLEDKLTRDGVMPTFYKRYVDDTLARMPSTDAAVDFLTTLNSLHPSLSFTMELPVDNKISFIGIVIIKNRTKIDTQVYRKPTNTGLLLHFQSHTDKRYNEIAC